MQAGDNGGARGRADGRDGPSVGIAEGALRKRVDMGRGRVGVAIAAHLRAVVLAGDPEDIGLRGDGGGCGEGEKESEGEREKAEGAHEEDKRGNG